MNNCKMLINVQKATIMCMYVAHWNIFMVNKRDLLKKTPIHSGKTTTYLFDTGRDHRTLPQLGEHHDQGHR